jgi:hypothetical protein
MSMITRQILHENRDQIIRLARYHGASDVRVFGSVARGHADEGSDVDLVVRFDRGRSFFDQAGLIGDLEDLLGVRVDVIDENGMRPRFREIVLKEASAI